MGSLGMNWGILGEYTSVAVGLVIGTLAHFGRLFANGTMPTLGQAAGFIMQLGMIGIISIVTIGYFGIDNPDTQTFATAILAVSAQEVVEFLKKNGWRAVVNRVIQAVPEDSAPEKKD